MSVAPIGSSSTSPLQQPAAMQGDWQNVLSSVSSTLGLNTGALQQELQSGQSLSSIAEAQGVSQQTLTHSITSALIQAGSTASGSQLQQIATNIADRTTGAGGHNGHHHQDTRPSASTEHSFDSALRAAVTGVDTLA